MTRTAAMHWRELAQRRGNGIEIALLWSAAANRFKVVVSDERLCHHVELEIADRDALNAFHDPFVNATRLLRNTDEFGDLSTSLLQTARDEGATHD